jgi:hypothetical protein
LPKSVSVENGFNNVENTKILNENLNLKAIDISEKNVNGSKCLVLNMDFKNLYKK